MVDRTDELWKLVRSAAERLRLPQEKVHRITSARILRRSHSSDFGKAACTCERNIEEVRQFLAFSSRDYLQPGRSSSLQKDKIEEEVVLFSKACSKQIGLLQERVSNLKDGGRMSGVSPQAVAHWQGVVLILTERLAEVLGEFGRIKKARFRQEAQRYSRRRASRPVVRSPGGSTAANTSEAAAQPQFLDRSAEGVPQEKLAMLQAENDALVQELMSRSRQVYSVEKTMQDISVLNSMFSEQILTQAAQVEQLYHEAVNASQRVEQGNDSLRKAIKLNSSARIYIIIVYCIAIFGLLFLDRYSSRFGPV